MTTDQQMADFEKRMEKREDRPPTHPGPESAPWTAKVERELMAQIGKALFCKACNHRNQPKSQPLLYIVRFDLMRELIPLPTYICNNCGTHFSPPAFRKIIKAALQKHEKAIDDYRKAAGGEGG